MSVLLEKKEKTEITTGFFRFEFLRVVYRYVKNWHGQIPVHRTCNQEGLGSSHTQIFLGRGIPSPEPVEIFTLVCFNCTIYFTSLLDFIDLVALTLRMENKYYSFN